MSLTSYRCFESYYNTFKFYNEQLSKRNLKLSEAILDIKKSIIMEELKHICVLIISIPVTFLFCIGIIYFTFNLMQNQYTVSFHKWYNSLPENHKRDVDRILNKTDEKSKIRNN